MSIEKYASINGIRICYEDQGKGEPVILIHGIGAKKETWVAQFDALSVHFRVIAFDMRGVGKSDRPNEPYTMKILADDVKGLMDYLNIKAAHIIGRSLGGMVAQHFALNYPDYLQKLVLLTTNPQIPDEKAAEFIKNGRIEEIKQLAEDPKKSFWQKSKLLFHKDFRKEMKADPKKNFYGIWSVEDLIAECIKDPSTPQDITNLSNALRSHDIIGKLHLIRNETLLISGTHDRLTPKSSMIEIHKRIPNSTLHIIENTGHFLHLSRAPEVNRLIINFLKN